MTSSAQPVVTAADREAAAKLLGGLAPADLLAGRWDSLSLVQAIATARMEGEQSGRRAMRDETVRYQGCNVPPQGWWCSRSLGHDGPCAARELTDL